MEKEKEKYHLIAIYGKSGTGKDTLLKSILKHKYFNYVKAYTTRPKRQGEKDNYYFINEQEYMDLIISGEVLESTEFNDTFYGTARKDLKKDKVNICIVNQESIEMLLEDHEIELYIYQLVALDKIRVMRSLKREDYPDVDEIVRRYTVDKRDYEYFRYDEIEVKLMNNHKRDKRKNVKRICRDAKFIMKNNLTF